MVLAIMTLLREQAISQPFQPAVSVSHLRDEIIDVSDRKRLAARWDEACKIVRRDSRVAQSVQSIHGIPQDMLSWVSPVVVASPMAAQRQASPLVDNPDNADNGGGDENDRQPAIRSPQAQHRPYASSIYPNIADL
ncbi:hypothetical protein CAOG_000010 [Capsaspora owczarzaki ATCC 30864]|uniref:Uncharacterized protein n=2 Tax=Capsaspora owczarzaki (strain ATCC 30864) TaxID=595528 RepID=A0A0D2TZH1_CAPO3|nr:hypothetical protein CAOG_000010 [Capsaspora owczarzaki ATCC 30864]